MKLIFGILAQTHKRLSVTALVALGVLFHPTLAAEDLVDLYKLALQEDPQLSQVVAQLSATSETRTQARAQLFMPSVNLNANVIKNYQDLTIPGIGQGGNIDFTDRSYALNVTQPIFHYDRYMQLGQAETRTRQASIEVDAAIQDLIVRLAERYFDVLAAMDNLDFSRAEVAALERQLEQSQQRFEVGLIAITDVQEAQAGYDLARADQILADRQLDNAREALRELTSKYYEELAILGDSMPLVTPEPDNIDAWTETALQQNLRVTVADLGARVARDEIRLQYAGHIPSLDLVGTHGTSDTGGRFGSTSLDATTIGIELNVPIYEGGQVVSRTREAEYRHREALEQLEAQRRATQRQTRDAYFGVTSGISRVQALKQAVISNETAKKATEAGFAVGTRTAVDVVTTERELAQARRDYARARYDYILDTLRLKQAAGTLAPEDLTEVNSWLE